MKLFATAALSFAMLAGTAQAADFKLTSPDIKESGTALTKKYWKGLCRRRQQPQRHRCRKPKYQATKGPGAGHKPLSAAGPQSS